MCTRPTPSVAAELGGLARAETNCAVVDPRGYGCCHAGCGELAPVARSAVERHQRRKGPADQVGTGREHRLEASHAEPQRRDADHLERHIFLNVALQPKDGDLELWAVDRVKGDVLWKRPLGGGNNMQRKQNMSSPSPVTDGTTVWVMTGTGILKAFDFKGKELWVARHPEGLRPLRAQLGLRLLAAAARGRALRAGAARDEDRRSVVRAEDRRQDRQDALARRAADRGDPGVA